MPRPCTSRRKDKWYTTYY